MTPRKATEAAMREITGAIIAITLVMSAVFIPTAFMSGPVGIFYKQFSLTMAISIVLSGVTALTLTPVLCAILLKSGHGHVKKGFGAKFFNGFNKWYDGLSEKYQRFLGIFINRRAFTIGVLIAFIAGTGILGKIIPGSFIPNEDQGMFYVSVTTPAGATLERTKEVVNTIQATAQKLEGVESVSTLSGTNILSDGTGATYGTVLINLKKIKLVKVGTILKNSKMKKIHEVSSLELSDDKWIYNKTK
jgi:HAE1 family hydrophobic/amphiphilic exporter-1